MLSPAAHPVAFLLIPAAVAALGVLLAYACLRYADRLPIFPAWPRPAAAPARHRLTSTAADDPARRDWAAVTAERLTATRTAPKTRIVYDPLDPRIPLAEVERRMALYAADAPTDELVSL
jgi:hypothetical protein